MNNVNVAGLANPLDETGAKLRKKFVKDVNVILENRNLYENLNEKNTNYFVYVLKNAVGFLAFVMIVLTLFYCIGDVDGAKLFFDYSRENLSFVEGVVIGLANISLWYILLFKIPEMTLLRIKDFFYGVPSRMESNRRRFNLKNVQVAAIEYVKGLPENVDEVKESDIEWVEVSKLSGIGVKISQT